MTELTTIQYAELACQTMIKKFTAQSLPPVGHFHYHQGVFLSGMFQTYLNTNNPEYFHYIKTWVDTIVDDQGNIDWYDGRQLDDLQPGILLFPLWKITGAEKYRIALWRVINSLKNVKRSSEGGFWHKDNLADQMWLDGLYMAGPLEVQAGLEFKDTSLLYDAVKQAKLMIKNTQDLKTGLLFHAYDGSKQKQSWADEDTGHSPEFWGRSIGWVNIAILDELSLLPKDFEYREWLEQTVCELVTTLTKYQSADGRWYQVVNKGDLKNNWLENSASCLYIAAIYRAVQQNLIDQSFIEFANKGYQAVINSIQISDGQLLVGDVCIGTGVGDYDYYINRPTSINDLHGVGAFLLMCNSKYNYEKTIEE